MRVAILEDHHWSADRLKQRVLRLRPPAASVCLGSAVMLMRLAAAEQSPAADGNARARLRHCAGLA